MTARLDWRRNRIGRFAPCIHCGRSAICRDQQGRPCHKVCAEAAPSRGGELG